MAEIKRKPIVTLDANGDEVTTFDAYHTIADIARWIIEKDYDTDLVYMLIEGRETL